MTQLQDIIDSGYRELNLTAIGASPTTAQTTEGVLLLNRLYRFALGGSAGEMLFNWPLGNFGRENIVRAEVPLLRIQNPPANVRLVAVNEEAMTVYLPPVGRFLSDGARMGVIDPHERLAAYPSTLDANGNTIDGADTLLVDTDGTDATWLYRADLGAWMLLDNLDETDDNPFPEEFDDYFSIMLALRIAPRAGRTLSAETQAYFKVEKNKFEARYLQSAPLRLDPSLSWTSVQGYDQYWNYGYGGQQAFDQGWGVYPGGGWW